MDDVDTKYRFLDPRNAKQRKEETSALLLNHPTPPLLIYIQSLLVSVAYWGYA